MNFNNRSDWQDNFDAMGGKTLSELVSEKRITFTRRISRSGKNLAMIVTIPKPLHPLVEFGKLYKVSLEKYE